jgi:hypothetical protein
MKMADFCTKCAIEMWGTELPPDIDIQKIADDMEPGHYTAVLCEGCGMIAIAKDENGNILIGVLNEEEEKDRLEKKRKIQRPVKWIPYAEWETNYKGLQIAD